MALCRCGCGEKVKGKNDFVDDDHLTAYVDRHATANGHGDIETDNLPVAITMHDDLQQPEVFTYTNKDQSVTISRKDGEAGLKSLKKCFVIMPSGNHGEYDDGVRESEFIFKNIIVPAVLQSFNFEVQVIRETDTNASGAIDKAHRRADRVGGSGGRRHHRAESQCLSRAGHAVRVPENGDHPVTTGVNARALRYHLLPMRLV